MLTGVCRTVVPISEMQGNTLPERTVRGSGMFLLFGLAEERSCSVNIDRHYGPFTEVADFVAETLF
jgi:hypothetical protein